MTLQLRRALQAYDRLDVTEVDCGGGWFCQVRNFASVAKTFAKEQARIKAAGGIPKQKATTASVDLATPADAPVFDDNDPWLLGSFAADVQFMVQNVLVGWRGLIDDNGSPVPYNTENATELFLSNDSAGEQLYRELIAVSLNTKLYIRPLTEQAETDGKN